jgi:hypothetical protein
MFEDQTNIKRLERKAKESEAKGRIRYNLVDAFIFLERIENSDVKKELRNVLLRIDEYLEKI